MNNEVNTLGLWVGAIGALENEGMFFREVEGGWYLLKMKRKFTFNYLSKRKLFSLPSKKTGNTKTGSKIPC